MTMREGILLCPGPARHSPPALRLRVVGMGALALLIFQAACKREERGFRVQPPSASAAEGRRMTDFQPGPRTPESPVKNEYEDNAYALSEGKRLFQEYNCSGCHFNGGGGIGPALMDDEWLYGDNPENIFETIVEGRPNGMPSFRGKVPDYQVWQLVAYVRSLSGQVGSNAAPGRSDHMQTSSPEQSRPRESPKLSGKPR